MKDLAARRWGWWTLLVIGVVAAIALFAGCGGENAADANRAQPNASVGGTVSRPEIGFRNIGRLNEHYAAHGREFGSISNDDYLRRAQMLRDRPVGGPVAEIVRRDGTITRYDRESGAFIAFARDGIIRTFFRPNDGERYFRRQARR